MARGYSSWETRITYYKFTIQISTNGVYNFSLEQDIGFGRHCNFQTLLVLTGSSKVQTVLDYPNEHHMPDYYLNSISEFKQFFDDINN